MVTVLITDSLQCFYMKVGNHLMNPIIRDMLSVHSMHAGHYSNLSPAIINNLKLLPDIRQDLHLEQSMKNMLTERMILVLY